MKVDDIKQELASMENIEDLSDIGQDFVYVFHLYQFRD